jgi:hypothetical protein
MFYDISYASLNKFYRARAHKGVVAECFIRIEFPRIMGDRAALNGIQNGELYGVITRQMI